MSLTIRFSKALLITATSLAISACGFHLRGSYNLPSDIQTLSVTSFDPYGKITRELKNRLRLYGINLVEHANTIANLHIKGESYGESTLSLYQNATVAQRQFSYTLNYAVTIPEKGSYNFSAALSRTYLDNPLTALAKSVEENMLAQEMRIEATKQIMRQLTRVTAYIDEYNKKQAQEALLQEHYQTETGEDLNIEIRFQGKEPKGKPLNSYIKGSN